MGCENHQNKAAGWYGRSPSELLLNHRKLSFSPRWGSNALIHVGQLARLKAWQDWRKQRLKKACLQSSTKCDRGLFNFASRHQLNMHKLKGLEVSQNTRWSRCILLLLYIEFVFAYWSSLTSCVPAWSRCGLDPTSSGEQSVQRAPSDNFRQWMKHVAVATCDKKWVCSASISRQRT